MVKYAKLKLLVNAMDKGEKRFFRKEATRHKSSGENQYLCLFDAMEKGGGCDVADTPELRYYLQKMILRSLATYHRKDQPGEGSSDPVILLTWLIKKELYVLAGKVLAKAVRGAKELGDAGAEYELLKWKRRLLRWEKDLEEGELEKLWRREKELLETLAVERRCIHNHDLLFFAIQRRHKTELPKLDWPEEPPDSFEGALAYHTALGAAAQAQGRDRAANEHFVRNLEVWLNHPKQIRRHPDRYFSALVNHLRSLHQQERYGEFRASLTAYHERARLPRTLARQMQVQVLNLELVLSLNVADWKAAEACAADLSDRLKRLPNAQVLKRTVLYNIFLLLIIRKHHAAALNAIREFQALPKSEARKDLQIRMTVWELVLHVELGNHRLFPYRLRAMERGHRKQNLPPWWWSIRKLLLELNKMPRDRWPARIGKFRTDAEEKVESKGLRELDLWLKNRG